MLTGPAANASAGRRPVAAAMLAVFVGGCSFAGDATTDTAGIGAGAVAGALTANPFIGLAVGVAARWAAGAAVSALEREIQTAIQDQIAQAGGSAEPNVAVPWSIEQRIPTGSGAGAVIVVREFGAPLMSCREIVFSVFETSDTKFYVGTICLAPSGTWKWAVAEPATGRWGSLQ